ncbi:MAG: helix-turn-helix domain-containing protein [Bdellovibrionaceae bacterium]|nr:helix-turn-helix domain-containing protein [Pseudobdellovibrionaceae bacterium]
MLPKKYPNKLKYIREEVVNIKRYNNGQPPLTQAILAKQCGVTRQTIIAIENQDQMPSYPVAVRIAHLFKEYCKVTELFPLPPRRQTLDKSA